MAFIFNLIFLLCIYAPDLHTNSNVCFYMNCKFYSDGFFLQYKTITYKLLLP